MVERFILAMFATSSTRYSISQNFFSKLTSISQQRTIFKLIALALSITVRVRPKPGFGIGNQNQDQVSVSVSEPELFLPKPKLSPILKIYQKNHLSYDLKDKEQRLDSQDDTDI